MNVVRITKASIVAIAETSTAKAGTVLRYVSYLPYLPVRA